MTKTPPLTRSVISEEGVYGSIIVSGLIAASAGSGAPTWRTLLFIGITVTVFWAAHVYARAVATHGETTPDGTTKSIWQSFTEAVKESRGLLAAVVAPALALLLGVFGVLPDSVAKWVALWVSVAVLAIVGYITYSRRGARWWVRILGGVSTASFGIVIILAKAIISH
ncbi:hypothetical protein JF550_08015 [Microbacterium esteraromaticum]|uniref:Integral membrane protein n=1 Tax=Microbacterium esteraromaticum TaxID=57043 RepID=A0A939DXK1_9MICO|nr:hypothetical protein [Microbacterium esteraromaticum]MBN8205903.1 hypothetical protein [Microbacterium esteraromaticum]MBN8416058.1 hypothetical protein [Microbacterium esteraromaticum]